MSLFKCPNLDNIASPLISLVEMSFLYIFFPIQVFIYKNAKIFNIQGYMNSFSVELYFEIYIIVFLACFKWNNSCFCYIECSFISIKPKGKFPKVFIQSSLRHACCLGCLKDLYHQQNEKEGNILKNCVNHLSTKGKSEDQERTLAERQN